MPLANSVKKNNSTKKGYVNTAILPHKTTISTATATSWSFDFNIVEEAIIAVTPQMDVPIANNFDMPFWVGQNFLIKKYVRKMDNIVIITTNIDSILTLHNWAKLIFIPSKIIANWSIFFLINSRPSTILEDKENILKKTLLTLVFQKSW